MKITQIFGQILGTLHHHFENATYSPQIFIIRKDIKIRWHLYIKITNYSSLSQRAFVILKIIELILGCCAAN